MRHYRMSCGKCIGVGESKLWLDEQDNLMVQYNSSPPKLVGSDSRLEQLIKKLYDEAIQMESYSPPSSPALRIGVPEWQTASYSPVGLNNTPKTTRLFGKVPGWQTDSYSPAANKGGRFRRTKKSSRR